MTCGMCNPSRPGSKPSHTICHTLSLPAYWWARWRGPDEDSEDGPWAEGIQDGKAWVPKCPVEEGLRHASDCDVSDKPLPFQAAGIWRLSQQLCWLLWFLLSGSRTQSSCFLLPGISAVRTILCFNCLLTGRSSSHQTVSSLGSETVCDSSLYPQTLHKPQRMFVKHVNMQTCVG